MPPKAQPPAVTGPDGVEATQPEMRKVEDPPVHPAGPSDAQQGKMTDVPLQQATPEGKQAQARGFQAAGEAGTSQSRGMPGMGNVGKGMWGRFKRFMQKEAIRMCCGNSFVNPPRRNNHGHHRR